ncbi:MAG: type I methionyl aminopeptidase [Acidimicrobiia bacterium]|nr:type I methionyl aminopeptidase [Acidimicrobiia bacterium]
MNRLRSNSPCWCGSGRKLKRCHGDHQAHRRPAVAPGGVSEHRDVPSSIPRPPYLANDGAPTPAPPQIHAGPELERLRHACQVAAEVLAEAGAAVAPGVTTDELDAIAHAAYLRRGAYPSTLGYRGYRKSVCTSVNEVICHGIPDDRVLQPGDIVNVDVTAYIDGMHGDTSATFAVGEIDGPTASLVDLTRRALLLGIAAVGPERDLTTVGEAIQPFAFAHGLGVVRDYGGHGIGATFHAAPHVNHAVMRAAPVPLVPGLTFTVEPMLNAGTETHRLWPDGWTVVTEDLLPSAQFEHTVIVTETGVEILTLTAEGSSPAGTLATTVSA